MPYQCAGNVLQVLELRLDRHAPGDGSRISLGPEEQDVAPHPLIGDPGTRNGFGHPRELGRCPQHQRYSETELVLDRALDPIDQPFTVFGACVEEHVAGVDVGAHRLQPNAFEATFEPSHLHLRAAAHVDPSKERDVLHAVNPMNGSMQRERDDPVPVRHEQPPTGSRRLCPARALR